VDVVVSVGPNFFYTVILPCTLWFLDKGKAETNRRGKVLFIDARSFDRQVTRATREFRPEQIEFLSNIVRLISRLTPFSLSPVPPQTKRPPTRGCHH
jgi:type I restriction enzyme M protein